MRRTRWKKSMRRTRWVDKKARHITQLMSKEMKMRRASAKDVATGEEEHAARPRIGPKHPPKFLPEKSNKDGY